MARFFGQPLEERASEVIITNKILDLELLAAWREAIPDCPIELVNGFRLDISNSKRSRYVKLPCESVTVLDTVMIERRRHDHFVHNAEDVLKVKQFGVAELTRRRRLLKSVLRGRPLMAEQGRG